MVLHHKCYELCFSVLIEQDDLHLVVSYRKCLRTCSDTRLSDLARGPPSYAATTVNKVVHNDMKLDVMC